MTAERGSCGPAAVAVALIAERYFSELAWSAAAELAPSTASVARLAPPAAPRPEESPGVAFGPGLAAGAVLASGPAALALRLAASATRGRLFGAIDVTLAPAATEAIAGGRGRLRSVPIALDAGSHFPSGRLDLLGAASVRVAGEWMSTSGLPRAGGGFRLRASAGAEATARINLVGPLALEIMGGAWRSLPGRGFVVVGVGEVFAPAPWSASMGAGLLWRFARRP